MEYTLKYRKLGKPANDVTTHKVEASTYEIVSSLITFFVWSPTLPGFNSDNRIPVATYDLREVSDIEVTLAVE